jgi:hypothetical protein
MARAVEFDVAELDVLADDLVEAADRAAGAVLHVTRESAATIKQDARERVLGQITRTYLPHYPNTITYDSWHNSAEVGAEIGPDSDRPQGGMGPGVEFGSINTPPKPHLFPAFEDELPRYYEGLARAVSDVVLP